MFKYIDISKYCQLPIELQNEIERFTLDQIGEDNIPYNLKVSSDFKKRFGMFYYCLFLSQDSEGGETIPERYAQWLAKNKNELFHDVFYHSFMGTRLAHDKRCIQALYQEDKCNA